MSPLAQSRWLRFPGRCWGGIQIDRTRKCCWICCCYCQCPRTRVWIEWLRNCWESNLNGCFTKHNFQREMRKALPAAAPRHWCQFHTASSLCLLRAFLDFCCSTLPRWTSVNDPRGDRRASPRRGDDGGGASGLKTENWADIARGPTNSQQKKYELVYSALLGPRVAHSCARA